MILSLTCEMLRALVFHPSGYEVTMVRFDAVVWARFGMVETVAIHQVTWFVMLESIKDQVIGVDTPRQQVPPRVWYGTACLLIMDVVGSVPCSDEWEFDVVTRPGSHGASGAVVPQLPQETLALLWYYATLAKPGIRPIVNLCNSM
jgi:hypothetical protein